MKGALNTWVLAAAAAALVALPADVRAQVSPAATAADVRETDNGQRRLAQEHLHKAGAAIDQIALDEQPTEVREHIGELKRRLNALRQDHGSQALEPAPQEPTSTAERPDGVDREAQLAAIDRTITALLGSDQTTGATPRPHGTPAATSGQPGIEQTARTHLEQARTHMTAYAAAMGSAEQAAESSAPSDGVGSPAAMAASAPPSTADATATTSPTDPTPSPTGTSPTDMPQTPAAPGPAEYGALGASEPVPESRSHLLAARDSLASLTQMPQAAGITGDARVQVSQLITRFNELIATNAAWREPLDDVKRRLNTLLTVDDRDTPREAATGTSGTVVLDPDVRAKLTEFRSHLEAFERSAGGQATRPGQQEASSSITEATPGELATRASETDPTAASGSTSTGAAAAQMPGAPAGTVGGQPVQADAISDAAEAGRHIDAIEAILRRARGAHAGVTGTSGSTTEEQMTAGRSELEPSEIEAIRTHLNELRRLLDRREP